MQHPTRIDPGPEQTQRTSGLGAPSETSELTNRITRLKQGNVDLTHVDDIAEGPLPLAPRSAAADQRGEQRFDTGGEYVVVEPKELDEIAPGRSRSIDVAGFVDLDTIDPVFFDKTYFLGFPTRRGAVRDVRGWQ